MDKKNILYVLLTIAAIIALILLPNYATGYIVGTFITLLFYLALSQSWIIISGYSGYTSLATAAFTGVGIYTFAWLWAKMPMVLAILMSGLFSVVLALIIGYPVLKVRGPYFVILSYGLSELIRNLVNTYETQFLVNTGWPISTGNYLTIYYGLLIVAIGASFTAFLVKRSRFGKGLFAIKDDEDAAETMGVPTTKLKILAFALSGLFPGFAGGIFAMYLTFVTNTNAFNFYFSLNPLLMALLGGSTTVIGPIIGASIFTVIIQTLWAAYPYHYYLIVAAILILIVAFLPGGLISLPQSIKWRLKNRASEKS